MGVGVNFLNEDSPGDDRGGGRGWAWVYVCVSEGGLPKDAPLTGQDESGLIPCELESLDNWGQVRGDPDGQ